MGPKEDTQEEIKIDECINCSLFPIGEIKQIKGVSYMITRLEHIKIGKSNGKAVYAKPIGKQK
jgi:hypothetical protein